MHAWKQGWIALVLLALAACGGGGGSEIEYNPDESTPTRIQSSDGVIVGIVPAGAVSTTATLSLINRSSSDRGIAGPDDRTLLGALEFSATASEDTATDDTTDDGSTDGGTTASVSATASQDSTATEVTLGAEVAFTFALSPALPAGHSMTLYTYNASSNRYEDAGITAEVSDDGAQLEFNLSKFGRFAFYSLLAEEYPPEAPTGLTLVAASTQVRRLEWQPVADATTAGYNLYRAEADSDSFAKVNTDVIEDTVYSDELTTPGAYLYRVTTVNTALLESDPSAQAASPAVDFDLYFTFGSDRLLAPVDLTFSPDGETLAVADPRAGGVLLYNPDGSYRGRISAYGSTSADKPVSVAYSTDGSRMYIADRALASVFILNASTQALVGRFGTLGEGPGEFSGLISIAVTYDADLIGDVVVAADDYLDTLQTFTALGVYLDTPVGSGTEQGQVIDPGQLLFNDDGELYVVERGNERVQVFDADFAYKEAFALEAGPLGAPMPYGVTYDFRGRTYISDAANRRVMVYSSASELLFHFGADGSLLVEFSEDTSPRSMALDPRTGYLYVADTGAQRIVVFTS